MSREKTRFRICKTTYTDEMGVEGSTHFYIQKQKRLLGLNLWWCSVKHYTFGWEDINKTTQLFDSYEKAYEFAAALEKGVKPDSWRKEVVSYIN